jgi:hypothetical protein
MNHSLNRAALVLSAGAVATGGFVFADPIQYRLVRLTGLGLAVLLVFAGLSMAGALLGRRMLVAVAGVALLVAAALQLLQLGSGANWLGGDGSTVSLFLGVGVGLLTLGAIRVPDVRTNPRD